jgi:hypothetical protein
MMLAELRAALAVDAAEHTANAILLDNLLGKPSIVARRAALYRLCQLYGIGDEALICLVLHRLWPRDPAGQAMLALLCALARDPPLRDGASAVLDALPGQPVRWPAIAAAFAARHPGRLGEKMAKSLAQNAASSWTPGRFSEGCSPQGACSSAADAGGRGLCRAPRRDMRFWRQAASRMPLARPA